MIKWLGLAGTGVCPWSDGILCSVLASQRDGVTVDLLMEDGVRRAVCH